MSSFKFYENIEKNGLRWTYSNQWSHDDVFYYNKSRRKWLLSRFKLIQNSKKNADEKLSQFDARWILHNKERSPIGWADFQILNRGKFEIAHVFLGFESNDVHIIVDKIAVLISALFVMAHVDVIKIYVENHQVIEFLHDEQWGEFNQVWMPHPLYLYKEGIDDGYIFDTITISHLEWLMHVRYEENKKNLNYLVLRRERLESKEDVCAPQVKPKGLLQRFFSPKV